MPHTPSHAVPEIAKTVLVFFRYRFAADFIRNFDTLENTPAYDFHYLTDGHAPSVPDMRAEFYAWYRDNRQTSVFSDAELSDIVARCRYLRNIDVDEALRHIHATTGALLTHYDRVGPDVVISHMVDDYTTHIAALLAEKRGISFIGYAFSYFPDLVQITKGWAGSLLAVRQPDDSEVREILQRIRKRIYRQNYLNPSRYSLTRHVWRVLRYRLKLAVFAVERLRLNDPLNYHLKVTPYLAERKRIGDFPAAWYFDKDWAKTLESERARVPGRQVLYMPLAFSPESTLDYWIRDLRVVAYERLTLEMIEELSKHYTVVVKEHLHMQGIRPVDFHRRLNRMEGVVNVEPEAFSNDLLEVCDAVLLGGGSVGVEATIRNIPVVSYAPDVYWFAASNAVELDLAAPDSWNVMVRHAIADFTPMTEPQINAFLRKCLSSTVRMRDGRQSWPLIADADLRAVLDAN